MSSSALYLRETQSMLHLGPGVFALAEHLIGLLCAKAAPSINASAKRTMRRLALSQLELKLKMVKVAIPSREHVSADDSRYACVLVVCVSCQ